MNGSIEVIDTLVGVGKKSPICKDEYMFVRDNCNVAKEM